MNHMTIIRKIQPITEEINKEPLRNIIKNIFDKYDIDCNQLRLDNEDDDIKMTSNVYYDDKGPYEIYTRHWLNCVLSLSQVIKNVDFE